MSNQTVLAKAAEIKVGVPTRFSGDLTDASRWKYSVLAYLHLNKIIYDTDEKKIINALSYMTEGSAAAWAQNFYATAFSTITTPVWGTADKFWEEFDKAFVPVDLAINAMTKLKTIRQGTDLAKFIAEFKTLVAQANIKESISIIHFFENALEPGLRNRVYMKETVPKTFDKWVEAVVQLNANWLRSKAVTQGLHQKPYKSNSNTRYVPKPHVNKDRDPDAMDVDRLSEAERTRYMKEGRCFICAKTGHRSSDSSFHPKKKNVCRQNIEDEETDEDVKDINQVKDF
jgi:hypothetical protein